jgi:hypothetical protein
VLAFAQYKPETRKKSHTKYKQKGVTDNMKMGRGRKGKVKEVTNKRNHSRRRELLCQQRSEKHPH